MVKAREGMWNRVRERNWTGKGGHGVWAGVGSGKTGEQRETI